MPTQNKLTPIVSLSGINTVGIYTVGITELAGGGGVSKEDAIKNYFRSWACLWWYR